MLLTISLLLLGYVFTVVRLEFKRKEWSGPLALYGALIILHFAIPGIIASFSPDMFVLQMNVEFAANAQGFVLLSFLAFHVSYISLRPKNALFTNSTRVSFVPWSEKRLVAAICVMMLMGWLTRAYIIQNDAYFQIQRATQGDLEGPFFAAVRMVELFPMYCMLMACIFAWTLRNASVDLASSTSRWNRIVMLIMALELLYWLPTGRKEDTIHVFLLPTVIWVFLAKQLPSKQVIVGFIGFVAALFPLSFVYRNVMQLQESSEKSFLETIVLSFTEKPEIGLSDRDTFATTFDRLNLLEPVSACMRLIADEVWQAVASVTKG